MNAIRRGPRDLLGGALVPTLALVVFIVGCSPTRPWQLTVSNATIEPVLVRIQASGRDDLWMLQPFRTEALIRLPSPVEGAISVVDPATCNDVGATAWTVGPAMLAVIDRGATGAGEWEIALSADDPTDAPLAAPIAHQCDTR